MSEEEWAQAYNNMVEKYEEMLGNLMARIRRESRYETKFYVQLDSGDTLLDKPFDHYYEAANKMFQMGFEALRLSLARNLRCKKSMYQSRKTNEPALCILPRTARVLRRGNLL